MYPICWNAASSNSLCDVIWARRAASLPEQYIPEISEAVKKAGLTWSDFKLTDNTCGPHPPQESLAQEVHSLHIQIDISSLFHL